MTAISAIDARVTRPAPDEYAPYYQTYVDRVPDGDIVEILAAQVRETLSLVRSIPEERGGHRYADGKWSIREVVGHFTDAERIFSYRALRFARGDATPLPGFDENAYAPNSAADERTLASLADEFEAVRRSTVALFNGLSAEAWMRRGTSNGQAMSVRSFAWIAAGHERHHVALLTQRYLGGA